MPHCFETDGAAIYRQSFSIIRAEATLDGLSPTEEQVVVRMIHAAGMVGLEKNIVFTPGMAETARAALQGGAPILCDARMVSEGITRSRLPAQNRVVCTLHEPRCQTLRKAWVQPGPRLPLNCGGPFLQGALLPLATRRQPFSTC